MEKIVITGSTGFVGRYVVRQAIKKGYDIHLIVRNLKKAYALFNDKVKAYQIDDLTKKDELRKILEKINPQYVIHLIGIIQETKKFSFEKVHYEYSKCLYEILKDFSCEKIVHMSALGVGENASSKYHTTKLKAEKELINTGIPFVILRPSFIIGPEQLLFIKLKPFLKKSPFLIFPDIRSYYFQPVDVRDVAECFINAIEYKGSGVFELCGDERVTLKDIVRDYMKHLGKYAIFIPVPKLILKILADEQYKMMWKDNVCGYFSDAFPIEKILERNPTSYKEQTRWSALNQ